MTTVLITGSSRGIGLDLVRQFLQHDSPPKILIATCRNPDAATELKNFAKKFSNLQILKLDVDDIDSFPGVVEKVSALVGEDGLNVLINNAAVAVTKSQPELTWQDYERTFHTNTIAPIFLTRALLPLIKKAARTNNKLPSGIEKAVVLNISSALGSVSLNNGTHQFHAYPESKAALNQSARTLAAEVGKEGVLVVSINPGWVRTALGGPNAEFSVEECTNSLIKIFYSLSEKDHDQFISYTRQTLTW